MSIINQEAVSNNIHDNKGNKQMKILNSEEDASKSIHGHSFGMWQLFVNFASMYKGKQLLKYCFRNLLR